VDWNENYGELPQEFERTASLMIYTFCKTKHEKDIYKDWKDLLMFKEARSLLLRHKDYVLKTFNGMS
jgi:hypothetical protein